MTQEGVLNSDWILGGTKSNEFKKLENNFHNLQINLNEEKEKTLNLEKKNFILENKLKEMDKKIQQINSDHKNEVDEMKQNFQKLIEEKDICLKKKDEIIYLLKKDTKKDARQYESRWQLKR
uniref:Uncharacterized protein n=1 Tax=Meloidogyne enterolobii TaxID=390850 RepID=A0A6V7XRG3_MELEN|nr:unnamed protein product [Meloidogyne enterolobii]